jgi:hypothetical protein
MKYKFVKPSLTKFPLIQISDFRSLLISRFRFFAHTFAWRTFFNSSCKLLLADFASKRAHFRAGFHSELDQIFSP